MSESEYSFEASVASVEALADELEHTFSLAEAEMNSLPADPAELARDLADSLERAFGSHQPQSSARNDESDNDEMDSQIDGWETRFQRSISDSQTRTRTQQGRNDRWVGATA